MNPKTYKAYVICPMCGYGEAQYFIENRKELNKKFSSTMILSDPNELPKMIWARYQIYSCSHCGHNWEKKIR